MNQFLVSFYGTCGIGEKPERDLRVLCRDPPIPFSQQFPQPRSRHEAPQHHRERQASWAHAELHHDSAYPANRQPANRRSQRKQPEDEEKRANRPIQLLDTLLADSIRNFSRLVTFCSPELVVIPPPRESPAVDDTDGFAFLPEPEIIILAGRKQSRAEAGRS